MAPPVVLEVKDEIAFVTLQSPPVNALGGPVRQGLAECLQKALDNPSVRAIVIKGKGVFSAGADITEFAKPAGFREGKGLVELLEDVEGSSKLVVAAINGFALGGGLEVALACHYRIATPRTKLGLPEVKIGLVPGAGGTQRLPRLVGVQAALPLVVSGEPTVAPKALKIGLVDEVVPGKNLEEEAVAFVRKLIADGKGPRRCSAMTASGGGDPVFAFARKETAKTARGLKSPMSCIDAVEAATTASTFQQGMDREREIFQELYSGKESKALQHVFFAERSASKVPGLKPYAKAKPVRKIAVVGAGIMGQGIAMCFTNVGVPVRLVDVSAEAIERGIANISRLYQGSAKKGKITQEVVKQRLDRLQPTVDYYDLFDVDLVIEAVFEDMQVKKAVFAKLDRFCPAHTILASNTSTLDIDEIASATSRKNKVIGMHFFVPANVMRLLENIRGTETDDETIATAMEQGKRIKKVTVLVGNCDGFAGNRMQGAMSRQQSQMLLEGVSPDRMDKIMEKFGYAMGGWRVGDTVGLDTGMRISNERAKRTGVVPPMLVLMRKMVAEGRLGQKTGKGWYKYNEGSREAIPDPIVEQYIKEVAKECGIQQREISDAEILQRCLYSLINEGAKILEEGIATKSSDLDMIFLYGFGFPVGKGGPCFWADTFEGVKTIADGITKFREQYGEEWQASSLLTKLAEKGKGFKDFKNGRV